MERNPGKAYGEIDVMENVGFQYNTSTAAIHGYSAEGKLTVFKSAYKTFNNDNNFHTYKVDWNSQRLLFYLDDVNFFSFNKSQMSSNQTWPFDVNLKIIINNAIGGKWGGSKGIDDSIFPTYYIIDYIRQYNSA